MRLLASFALAILCFACELAAPSAPSAPMVLVHDRTNVTVTPQAATRTQTGVGVRYELRRSDKPGGPWKLLAPAVVDTPVEDQGQAGMVLSYVVVAVGEGGETPSPEVLAPLVPAVPTGIHVEPANDAFSYRIAWDRAEGVTSWLAYLSSSESAALAGAYEQFLGGGLLQPSTDVSLQVKGWVVVKASNASGESDPSVPVYVESPDPSAIVDAGTPSDGGQGETPDAGQGETPDGGSAEPDGGVVVPAEGLWGVQVTTGADRVVATWRLPSILPRSIHLYVDGSLASFVSTATGGEFAGLQANRRYTVQLATAGDDNIEHWQSELFHVETRRYVQVVGRGEHFCARDDLGRVFCWGANAKGQLGSDPEGDFRWARVQVLEGQRRVDLAGASAIGVGLDFSCALQNDATVSCWGNNSHGQAGDGTIDFDVRVARRVINADGERMIGASALSVGSAHACALTGSGYPRCWGSNAYRQIGAGDAFEGTALRSQLVVNSDGSLFDPMAEISAGDLNTCARGSDKRVYCWGSELYEQNTSHVITRSVSSVPVLKLMGDGNPLQASRILNTPTSTCAVTTANAFVCWGPPTTPGNVDPGSNELLDQNGLAEPTAFFRRDGGPITGAVAISGSSTQTCVRVADGNAWCWGPNARSMLNDDTQLLPVELTDASGNTHGPYSAVASGDHATCVVTKDDGRLRCWGRNASGQAGTAEGTGVSNAIDVPIAAVQ